MSKAFISPGPDNQVIGQNLTAYIECSNRDNILPYLQRHGLDRIDPERWYDLQDFLNVLNEIVEDMPGQAMADFVSIGMQVIHTGVFPPEIDNMPFLDIMRGWNEAFHMNNRGADSGDILFEQVGPNHIKMIHTCNGYPDNYLYGAMYGAAQRWLPSRADFTVYYDEEEPRFEEGGERTVIHIEWYE